MNLIQFTDQLGETRVGRVVDTHKIEALDAFSSVYELSLEAIRASKTLAQISSENASGEVMDYQKLADENRLLSPIHHPDPAHLLVTGTGLTHLGSADTRDAMHAKLNQHENDLTDSMRMFRWGVQGGKPGPGEIGVAPEWFYKGDGATVVAPGQPVDSPEFALDIGDEAEIVGIYVIGDDGQPYRLGFALGNEYSDHRTEKLNYLYLAHSKLRPCSFGPELRLGKLPDDVRGVSRIRRNGEVVWEKEFLSGERNMCHSIANLEFHHFKYRSFLRPGDVHIHFFGTATLSFGDGFETLEGDEFELSCDLFGRALCNRYRRSTTPIGADAPVKIL